MQYVLHFTRIDPSGIRYLAPGMMHNQRVPYPVRLAYGFHPCTAKEKVGERPECKKPYILGFEYY
jgi:hypothetical protein